MLKLMEDIKLQLKTRKFSGDMDDSKATLETYSHDASMFEILPQLVITPRTVDDVITAVKLVAETKKSMPSLSLTARSGGTDMSGAAINESIIVDFNKYLTKVLSVDGDTAISEPGAFYRDFDKLTGEYEFPSYPASRDTCTIGGIVNNNSGGERSLRYGKTQRYVPELKFVFADGIERVVVPLSRDKLILKMAQSDFEGIIYRDLFELIEKHYDQIKAARPHVSKDSTGYRLWDVWDRETGIFDLTQVIVGAQGTLGFVTQSTLKLVKRAKHSGLLVLFMHDIDNLGELIPAVLKHKPVTFESFDDATLWLSIKFMPSFLRLLGPVSLYTS